MTCGKGESTGLTKSSAVAAFRQAKETGACRCLSPQPSDDWDLTRAPDSLIGNRKKLTSKDVTVLLFCIVNKFAVKDVDIHVHISRSWFSSSPLDLLTKSRSSCVFGTPYQGWPFFSISRSKRDFLIQKLVVYGKLLWTTGVGSNFESGWRQPEKTMPKQRISAWKGKDNKDRVINSLFSILIQFY